MNDHFTPFAEPTAQGRLAARRTELRIERETRWSEAILSSTRIGVALVVASGLILGLSTAILIKRAAEIARAAAIERPA